MKKIYLVSRGSYSDYSIMGAFSTKENAQAMINAYAGEGYGSMNDEIEEFVLDSDIRHYRKGECVWLLFMGRDGTVDGTPSKWPSGAEGFDLLVSQVGNRAGETVLRAIICALSAEHAIKIANERRAFLIANNEWPDPPETK